MLRGRNWSIGTAEEVEEEILTGVEADDGNTSGPGWYYDEETNTIHIG